jgi:ketosteroid isomerase-like protein
MRQAFSAVTVVTLLVTTVVLAVGTSDAPADAAFEEMANTERAFVQAAQVSNWKSAFLEYFADGIRGFEGEDIKAELRKRPDPPQGLEFWWEPRYGDIAASGELGWLTGPVRIVPPGPEKKPTFSNYASIWKRQGDGSFKVILDVGVDIPEMAPFPPGVTRVPMPTRYSGSEKGAAARDSLLEADRRLTADLGSRGQSAYSAAAAPHTRFHRSGRMPLTNLAETSAWLKTQPAWSEGETKFAEAAQSGDLGYTWGSYAIGADASGTLERGHYVRTWTRDGQGRWVLTLDVLQKQVKR